MTTIRFRRGTTAEWEAANPVLDPGEPGIATDTNVLRVGNGADQWTDLPRITGGGQLVLYEGEEVPDGTPDGTIIYRRPLPPVEIALIHSAATTTGATPAATLAVPLGATATSGNTLLCFASGDATIATPAGWTLDQSAVASNGHYLFRRLSNGSETGITLTPNSTASVAAVLLEYSGLTGVSPLAASAGAADSSTPPTRSTDTTGSTTGAAGGLALASMGYSFPGGGTPTSTTAWSNGFTELVDMDVATISGADGNTGVAVASAPVVTDGTFECTGTFALATRGSGIIAVYKPS